MQVREILPLAGRTEGVGGLRWRVRGMLSWVEIELPPLRAYPSKEEG